MAFFPTDLGGILGAASSAVGIASDVRSLFGGGITQGAKAKPFRGLITTPGFRFGEGTLVRRPETEATLAGQRRIGGLLEARRREIRPGFGRLTESLVTTVRNARGQAVGNLRESLARRNVLGASFAQDAIARTELEFQQQEERVRAEAFVAELKLEQENLANQFKILESQLAQENNELQTSLQFLVNVDQKKIKDAAKSGNVERQLQLMDAQEASRFLDADQLAAVQRVNDVLRNAGLNFFGDGSGDPGTDLADSFVGADGTLTDAGQSFFSDLEDALRDITSAKVDLGIAEVSVFDPGLFGVAGAVFGGPLGGIVGSLVDDVFGTNLSDALGSGQFSDITGADLEAAFGENFAEPTGSEIEAGFAGEDDFSDDFSDFDEPDFGDFDGDFDDDGDFGDDEGFDDDGDFGD